MAKLNRYLIAIILCIGLSNCIVYAQLRDSISVSKILQLADEIVSSGKDNRKSFIRQSLKRLENIQAKEKKILKQLPPDALKKSESLLLDIQGKISELETLDINPDTLLNNLPVGPYLARFDSLTSLFGFAGNIGNDLPIINEVQKEIAYIRQQIGYTGMIQQWLKDRQEQWINLISINNNIIPDQLLFFIKEWKAECNIYNQQITYWKEILKDSKKIEREVFNQLNKLPAFREFMSRNSELSRLFGPVNMSGNSPAGQPIPGLQSIQILSEQLQTRFGSAMLQGGGLLQPQLQNGMNQLQQAQTTSVQGLLQEFELPTFMDSGALGTLLSPVQKENSKLKALTPGQRFEFGWNLQSALRLQDFPAIRDVGLSAGYKINPRSVIGVGVSYKFALGKSWKEMEWTHEGFGIRSFIDWRLTEAGGKLFKGFWLTGGFEMNYWSRIASNAQWMDLAWRTAGMIGLTKTIPGKRNNGKLQILFNYLDNTLPPEDRISIRWGKTF